MFRGAPLARTIDRSRDRVALSDRSSSRSPARCVASPPPSSSPCCSPSASRPCRSTAGSTAKVVVVVGPVGDHNAHYKSDARDIAAEARKHTSNVVTLFTPNATWPAVKAAAQGASVFVYLGHGNGWPSIYPPFQTVTKDGLGLDPQSGADGDKHVYYGEDYIRNNIRLAPNAVVLLYHLCYASGNTEPGLSQGTFAEARERVDNYGAGFIGAGARAVIAEGHPDHPATSEIRQLFTTNRTLDQVFRNAPTWHGHLQGPFASQRTPGLRYQMDADTLVAVGLLPLDRRRPRAPGVRGDGRDAVADRREPGGLRRPGRRRGRRGGRRRAVRLAGEGPGPGGDGRHHASRRRPGCG